MLPGIAPMGGMYSSPVSLEMGREMFMVASTLAAMVNVKTSAKCAPGLLSECISFNMKRNRRQAHLPNSTKAHVRSNFAVEYWYNVADLRPNPNAIFLGSIASSAALSPVGKNRSGRNDSGSG